MKENSKISEGSRGGPRFSAENTIPAGAKKLPFSTNSYEFYFYKKGKKAVIYIRILDYHPGILKVPLNKLEEMIKYLKGE